MQAESVNIEENIESNCVEKTYGYITE